MVTYIIIKLVAATIIYGILLTSIALYILTILFHIYFLLTAIYILFHTSVLSIQTKFSTHKTQKCFNINTQCVPLQILMSVMNQIIHVIPMLTVLTLLVASHAHV